MNLIAWHRKLHAHFFLLKGDRQTEHPIFGLEHGLSDQELKELQEEIRAHIKKAPPENEHWLAWIVYASEIGYRYAGDEYWQTFERETPHWERHGDRNWIRRCFLRFHKEYRGARPTGAWADHFSIICWPITHAILPKDLQRQLARVLYDLRHSFSAELFETPLKLGEQIASRSWDTTSRFQNFVQEPLLVGQIAAALLLQEERGFRNLILPETLKRISEDLDRERLARDWLQDARKIARERVQLRGLSRPRTLSNIAQQASIKRAHEEITALAIEPRLVLRPVSSISWEVQLEIPNLSPLLGRFPQLREVLTGSRCIVAGSSGKPIARGRLLYGTQRVLLQRWPSASEILLHFEQSSTELEWLLKAECLLRPGPVWLFKIASDGLAYEVRSLMVRPGHSYLLTSTTNLIPLESWGVPVSVSCAGVYAVRLDLPLAIPIDLAEKLKKLGLKQAKILEVWPAGLTAAGWDGEGRGEWLSYEHPCLGIRVDHLVDSLLVERVVELEDSKGEKLEIQHPTPGAPIFVELPKLSPGTHKLYVSAQYDNMEEVGQLEIVIREPQAWRPGANPQGILNVFIEPGAPTLEQLWENRVAIEVNGPVSRKINCTITLFDRDANILHKKRLPPLQLPVTVYSWRSHFEKHFRHAKEIQNSYDLSHSCQLDLNGEELGTFSLICEREFVPLRWIVCHDNHHYELKLLDDRGAETPVSLCRYTFKEPDLPEPLEYSTCLQGFHVPPDGGMYVARSGDDRCAAVLLPTAKVKTFGDLRIEPQVADRGRSPKHIIKLLSCIDLWASARLTGNLLSLTRQRETLFAMIRHIFTVVGGDQWRLAEDSFRNQKGWDAIQNFKRAISNERNEAGLGAALFQEYVNFANMSVHERISCFSSLVNRFVKLRSMEGAIPRKISDTVIRYRPPNYGCPEWISEFALRLASHPAGLIVWAGNDLKAALVRILYQIPVLARAARFLVLIINQYFQPSPIQGGQLYAGWEWK